ncbi:MAG: DNA replication/repair protein RecF [Lachnospiraceae bacterium]|nr:DNA replication/repair protein RecF [Lachnospiraceae bacterium]
MYIELIDLMNFRNYERQLIRLDRGVNIFYGDNAQGKTNILEAVYLAGTTRSHKGSKDREMIRKGEEESHIRMDLVRAGIRHRIDLHLKKNRSKGIAIDRIPVKRASELFGIASLVFFSPEDLNIIKNGPSARRRFVNFELCQLDRIYLNVLGEYSRCLLQRNKLLKEMADRPERTAELDVWDEQLLKYGLEVIRRRASFIQSMNEKTEEIHRELTDSRETLLLKYEPNTTENSFAVDLAMSRERDLRYGETHTGPHRDDMAVLIDGMDSRVYGSQGQQRSAALSLKLAEIRMIQEHTGDTPVLLLDDVLSELDSSRQNQLLGSIRGIQTLITCTGLDDFVQNHFEADTVFHVTNGHLSETE